MPEFHERSPETVHPNTSALPGRDLCRLQLTFWDFVFHGTLPCFEPDPTDLSGHPITQPAKEKVCIPGTLVRMRNNPPERGYFSN